MRQRRVDDDPRDRQLGGRLRHPLTGSATPAGLAVPAALTTLAGLAALPVPPRALAGPPGAGRSRTASSGSRASSSGEGLAWVTHLSYQTLAPAQTTAGEAGRSRAGLGPGPGREDGRRARRDRRRSRSDGDSARRPAATRRSGHPAVAWRSLRRVA